MNRIALIVTILALFVFHVSAQDESEVTRVREEGEIILEKADITASKSSDDLGCLVDLVTSKEPCQVNSEAADGEFVAWFEFSLNDKPHCVTKIEVSTKTIRRDQAHYRYNCDTTGCSQMTFIEGTEVVANGDRSDEDAFGADVLVMEGEEEGRSDPSCTGMVGNKIKFEVGMADLTFYEVWAFGGKFISH